MSKSFKEFIVNSIKNTVIAIAIAIIAGSSLSGCNSATELPTQQTATVYRCDNATDTVYCETADGNEWTFEGYGYEVGDNVTIVIDDGCVVNATN